MGKLLHLVVVCLLSICLAPYHAGSARATLTDSDDDDGPKCYLKNTYDGLEEVVCPHKFEFSFVSTCEYGAFANSSEGKGVSYNANEVDATVKSDGHSGSGNYTVSGVVFCHDIERTVEIGEDRLCYGNEKHKIEDCDAYAQNTLALKVKNSKNIPRSTFTVFPKFAEKKDIRNYNVKVGETILLEMVLHNARGHNKEWRVGSKKNVVNYAPPNKKLKQYPNAIYPADMECIRDTIKDKKDTVYSIYKWTVGSERVGTWEWEIDVYDGYYYMDYEKVTFNVLSKPEPDPPGPTPTPSPENKNTYLYIFLGVGGFLFLVSVSAAAYLVIVSGIEMIKKKRPVISLSRYEQLSDDLHMDGEGDIAILGDTGSYERREPLLSSSEERMGSVQENDHA